MNAYNINIQDVTSKGMIPVIRKRDILRVRMLSHSEKKGIARGAPDIIATSPSGVQKMLSRSEVVQNYRYLSGKKISLAGWKSSSEYTIYKQDNTPSLAMMIPSNCTVNVNNVMANQSGRKGADYIVALADPSGNPIITTIGIIPSAMFKKMYHIPNNEVIQRNKGKGHKLSVKGPGGEQERGYSRKQRQNQVQNRQQLQRPPVRQSNQINYAKDLNMDTASLDFGDGDMYSTPTQQTSPVKPMRREVQQTRVPTQIQNRTQPVQKQPVQRQPVQRQPVQGQPVQNRQQQQQPQNTYRYIATGRLFNSQMQLVGFIVQNQQGQTKNVTTNQMIGLCEKRLVANIMLARQGEDGKIYLRGNNIRIESLPSYNI